MPQPASALRILSAAVGVGLAADLVLRGHEPGINILIAVVVLLGAGIAVAGGIRRVDPVDAWIPIGAVALAAFVAIRDDAPLVLLDLAGALGLSGASFAIFAGESVTRRSVTGVVGLAARVGAAAGLGGLAVLGRVRDEAEWQGPVSDTASRAAPVVRGLLIGVPLLVVFAALFGAADPIFEGWLARLTAIDVDLGELPARVLFVLVVAWLAAGLLWFGSVAKTAPAPRSLGAAAATPDARLLRLGSVEALTILVALDVLFAAFVALQLAYLFGGLDTLSAIGMTYANYARRGFFELVAVVFLVGGLLMVLEAVVATRTRAFVGAALTLVGLTAVVLVSSFLRLRLYQEAYGWTELRFYVLAAIVFLGIDLVAAAVLIARNRAMWLPHAVAIASLVVLVGVNVIGPQSTITDRNLERALVPGVVPEFGEVTLDTLYLGRLGADGIPALVAALPRLAEPQRSDLLRTLRSVQAAHVLGSDLDWPATNLARARAREALATLPER